MSQQARTQRGFSRTTPVAKITHPSNSAQLARGRLFAQLDACRDYPVTWVSASAGSGKTTLVSDYLAQRQVPSIWYRVDSADGDVATFFYYMGLALKKSAPRRKSALPLLAPENMQGIEAFTLRYFDKLYRCLKPPFVLVFDDYQRVHRDARFHDVIRRGFELLPKGINAIVISRERPPPPFARMRVNGVLTLMEADALRFSLEESQALVKLHGCRDFPQELLHLIHSRTRGWAAGLTLLMEEAAITDLTRHSRAGETHQGIFDYFASEVFAQMPEEMQDFLLRAAFLPWMRETMASRHTGNPAARAILSRLHQDGFFTERSDDAEPVYRFHPLFSDFLQARAKDKLPGNAIQEIQRRAADLLTEAGDYEEAARILIAAGDLDAFIAIVDAHAGDLVVQGRFKTLAEWLSHVPAAVLQKLPWLLYWSGICAVAHPDESRDYLERAFHLFNDQGNDAGALRSWSGAVDSLIMAQDDFKPLDRWIDWLEQWIETHAAFPNPEIEAVVASSMFGALLWRRPEHPGMSAWGKRALALSRDSRGLSFIQARIYALTYYMWNGDHVQGGIIVDEMKLVASAESAPPLALLAFRSTEAFFALLRDNYERALDIVSEGLVLADETGVHPLDFLLLGLGAYGALRKGDPHLTATYVRRMEASLRPGQRAAFALYYNVAALQHLFTRNISEALSFAEKALALTQETGVSAPQAMSRIVVAQAAYEAGDKGRAVRELDEGERSLHRMDYPLVQFTCALVRAYFAYSNGDEDGATATLAAALKLGRRNGYAYAPMLWRPQVWSLLCARALEADIEVAYVRDLIRRQALVPDETMTEMEAWPWPIRIHTLGRFALFRSEHPTPVPTKGHKKPIQMLKTLIALGPGAVRKERVIDTLWPDKEGDAGNIAFHTTLHRLRRWIGDERAIQFHEGSVSLNPQHCRVDAWTFEKLCHSIAHAGANASINELSVRASRLYHGAFLPADDDLPPVIALRERLHREFLRLNSTINGATALRAGKIENKPARAGTVAEEKGSRKSSGSSKK